MIWKRLGLSINRLCRVKILHMYNFHAIDFMFKIRKKLIKRNGNGRRAQNKKEKNTLKLPPASAGRLCARRISIIFKIRKPNKKFGSDASINKSFYSFISFVMFDEPEIIKKNHND